MIWPPEALLAALDEVKEQGFGEDIEEQEEGLRCIAVPVFDRFGVVIAGLSISFPTIRFSEDAKGEEGLTREQIESRIVVPHHTIFLQFFSLYILQIGRAHV